MSNAYTSVKDFAVSIIESDSGAPLNQKSILRLAFEKSLSAEGTIQNLGANTLWSPDESFESMTFSIPETFSVFRKRVETSHRLQSSLHERLYRVEPDCDFTSTSALRALYAFVHKEGSLFHYKETRNNLFFGNRNFSKLSMYLNSNALSALRVWKEVLEAEKQRGANDSSYWFKVELLWREFFTHAYLKKKDVWFEEASVCGRKTKKANNTPVLLPLFIQFIEAKTENALINAGVNELISTGFSSNRMRQLLASYFLNELELPWLWGAKFFEYVLLDYAPGPNYGNWAYLAGVGYDPRSFQGEKRWFNLKHQEETYDPQKKFQEHWCSRRISDSEWLG